MVKKVLTSNENKVKLYITDIKTENAVYIKVEFYTSLTIRFTEVI